MFVVEVSKKYFGVIWGAFTFAIELGVWFFSMIVFDHLYSKYNKDKWGR